MTNNIRELLLAHKNENLQNKQLYGNVYSLQHKDYLFVDELGYLYKPNRVTANFSSLLKKNNLPHIRFHDLRHSCASLQLNNGVSMKEIQNWLVHSTFATTADLYAHLDNEIDAEL